MNELQSKTKEALSAIIGRRIECASSSLTNFAIGFADESGIIFDAVSGGGDEGSLWSTSSPWVAAKLVSQEQLPKLEEAVCSVDWSWISGSIVEGADSAGAAVRLTLKPAGPLIVGAALWQGKPFLSFQPYKPAKK